jgi:hypothetical protein
MKKAEQDLRHADPSGPAVNAISMTSDVRAMLGKHGVARANWDYKGGFGIVESPEKNRIRI